MELDDIGPQLCNSELGVQWPGDGGSSVIRRKRGGIDEEDSTTSSKNL